MAGNNCMCQQTGVLIFSCSGSSDVGELSDLAARKMAKCGQAKMFCIASIGANIPEMIESAKAASKLIAIDGCPVACSKKILEQAGFTPVAFNLKDMGFIKGKTKADDESIEQVFSKITGGKVEEADRNTSGGCCGS
ncbi:MAG: putative zinc-binding protein [Candidatus Omnitrophica bacterium]|nr:putative zinc-binding protein [Candidatus Omnitrophota bacterium]